MRSGGPSSGPNSAPASVAAALMCALVLTGAVHPDATSVPAEGEDDGMAVLHRASDAHGRVAYTGVREVRGPEGEDRDGVDLRVVNRPSSGLAMSPLGEEDEESAFVVLASSALESLDERLLVVLEDTYQVVDAGRESLDGRPAHLVEALRADSTVAGRFWVDTETHLLLGHAVYDRSGAEAFSSHLTDLSLGEGAWPDEALGDSPWGDALDGGERRELREAGWTLPEHLTWDLRLVDTRSKRYGERRVVHAVYSDGLSQVSVFVQRGKLGTEHPSTLGNGYTGTGTGGGGVTTGHDTIFGGDVGQYQSVWQANGFVYTVLADAPADLASSAVAALPGPEDSGFWARVLRGLSRLGLL
ncbi:MULTISPECIES: sigma-E factor regulatory protein RseB domain-containing protein [Nocardiopsis]|uniref:sigma-E factor regulatory protein RseB domain-containing protein n=1 Tax=Nocardiopsis TaxID=2013 RepID=UPI0003499010|nr:MULTISPECIES: sigma-E factor regulatory protein RseB domain-containing protein [Nocardiopsis]